MNLKEFFVKSCPACHQVLVLNKTPSGLECKHCGEPLKWERDWKVTFIQGVGAWILAGLMFAFLSSSDPAGGTGSGLAVGILAGYFGGKKAVRRGNAA